MRKDGSRFLSDSVVRGITDEAGDLIGFTKIVHDVTERKLAEEESKRLSATLIATNTKLQGANAELASFADEVAHDILLPVRGVCLYAELLARSIGTVSQKDQSELVDILIRSSQQLQHLVDSLLEYGALSKEVDAPEPVALEDVLQEVRENLSAAIAGTDADLSWGSLPVVKSHRVRMVRLLQNLVSNAIKYARPGTRPVIHVSAKLGDREWQLAVSDNGRGVGPEVRESIFAPLKRLHGSNIPGTGLGLAICRRIVEAEGGRIWVDSSSGSGSTFYFTLPVDDD
jgi:signal transduction histidine kinase